MAGETSSSRVGGCNPCSDPEEEQPASCDNWRGIALLDVVGKLVARIVQSRLQIVAEQELPESQCGFRRGHGCTG